MPDARSGELVKAFIVRRGQGEALTELLAYCRDNLAAYKVPKVVEFIAELPKSAVGKICGAISTPHPSRQPLDQAMANTRDPSLAQVGRSRYSRCM